MPMNLESHRDCDEKTSKSDFHEVSRNEDQIAVKSKDNQKLKANDVAPPVVKQDLQDDEDKVENLSVLSNFGDKFLIKIDFGQNNMGRRSTTKSPGRFEKTKYVMKSSMQTKAVKKEEIFEGYGTGAISNSHSSRSSSTILYSDLKEGLRTFFDTCDPNDKGLVSTQFLMTSFEINFKEVFPEWYLDSIRNNVIPELDEEIDFATFCSSLERWVEETFTSKSDDEACNVSYSRDCFGESNCNLDNTIKEEDEIDFGLALQDAVDQPFQLDNDCYRRSTLIHPNKVFVNVIQNEFPLPSPIRLSEGNESLAFSLNRTFSPDQENNFDFTVGSLEAEANITPLDPIELQHEVFELTYTNRRLVQEKEELASQNIQGESMQSSLRDRCKKLEESLLIAQKQLGKLPDLNEENRKLKAEIVEEFQRSSETKISLNQLQHDHENLLKNFESLKDEAQSASERLEEAFQEKEVLNQKITECLSEIAELKSGFLNANEKLTFKENNIEDLEKTVSYLEGLVQGLQDDNRNLLGELRNLKDNDRITEINAAFMNEIVQNEESSFEQSLEEKFPQSIDVANIKETETAESSTSNIRDEICSLDISDVGFGLPFCEKEISFTSSNNMFASLEKYVSKWQLWNQKSSTYAESLFSKGSLDDEAQTVIKIHIDELMYVTNKWKNLINLKIGYQVSSPCKTFENLSFNAPFLSSLSIKEPENQREEIPALESIPVYGINGTQNQLVIDEIGDNASSNDSSNVYKMEKLLDQEFIQSDVVTGLPDLYLQDTINYDDLLSSEKDEAIVSSSTESILQPKCTKYEHERDNTGGEDKDLKIARKICEDLDKPFRSETDIDNIQKICEGLNDHPQSIKGDGGSISGSGPHKPSSNKWNPHPYISNVILLLVGCLFLILFVTAVLSFIIHRESHNCYCSGQCTPGAQDAYYPFYRIMRSGLPPI